MSVRWTERDPFGDSVELTDGGWEHIIDQHDEVMNLEDQVRDTISAPGVIHTARLKANHFCYYKQAEGRRRGLFMCVIVDKTSRPYIKTAYLTDRIRGGALKWLRL